MSENRKAPRRDDTDGHKQTTDLEAESGVLNDLPDGIGCVEIWEHLSDRRRDD